jgi:hypothetical protein
VTRIEQTITLNREIPKRPQARWLGVQLKSNAPWI